VGKVKSRRKEEDEDYLYIGRDLRDELISAIAALSWDEEKARTDKIKSALQLAAPYRKGYLVDAHDWTWEDEDFLRSIVDTVVEDEGHSMMGRGMNLWNTRLGRQIMALRDKL
jgi:hypothetical protein